MAELDDEREQPGKNYSPQERERLLATTGVLHRLLKEKSLLFDEIQEERALARMTRIFLFLVGGLGAFYGAAMGSFGLASGHTAQIAVTTIKVPIFLLAAMLFCLPALFVFNMLLGSRMTFRQVLALLSMSHAVMAIVLGALAPITLFCVLTGGSYEFLIFENILAFATAGFFGLDYLWKATRRIAAARSGERDLTILACWMGIYALLASQLAWSMRPFIGDPNVEFSKFRELGGNFFSTVWRVMNSLLR